MYNDLMKTFQEQSEKYFSPMFKFNQLVAKNIEQLAQLQLDAAQSYTETTLAQLKTAAEISDVKTFVDFNASQLNALNTLSQKMIADGQKLQQLGQGFKDNLEALSKETLKTAQV